MPPPCQGRKGKMMTWIIRQLMPILLLACLTGTGCSMMSTAEEIKTGREAAPAFEKQYGGVYPNPDLQNYVSGVGMRMAHYAGRPELPWQFRVLSSSQINAFALPGGYVYITRGLLIRLHDEAELAGILGHESGHVAHHDTARQIQQTQNTQLATSGVSIIAGIFGVPLAGTAVGLAGQLSLLHYSRDQEHDADMAALRYMSAAGYNPQAMVTVMETLKQASSGKGGPQFLSTHPDSGNRAEYLSDAIRKNYPIQAEQGFYAPDEFRRHVSGLPP